jgi:hypothetical protein
MAQKMMRPVNPVGGFVDTRRATPEYAGGTADGSRTLTAPANLLSVTEIKAYLSTYDPFTYTAAVLDRMTVNDMIFAARHVDASNVKSIADYMTQQVARTS